MILINCAVKENQTVLDTSTNVNCISEKSIDGMKMVYKKDDSNSKVNGSYFTLGKVNLYITFNDGKKHKSIPSEFIVVGPDWPDNFSDLTLGISWLQEN
ncbi:2233_t:CDS:1, partial [Rhizophagus irregularis]